MVLAVEYNEKSQPFLFTFLRHRSNSIAFADGQRRGRGRDEDHLNEMNVRGEGCHLIINIMLKDQKECIEKMKN